MKALIIPSNIGHERLSPLTDREYIFSLPILGQSLFIRNIEFLMNYGFKNIIISANDRYPIQFDDSQLNYYPSVKLNFENNFNGSAGLIRQYKEELTLKDDIFLVIKDNILTDINLEEMLKVHIESGFPLTMAVKKVENIDEFEHLIGFDFKNKLTFFEEKLRFDDFLSRWINTGIMIFNKEIFDYMPSEKQYKFYDLEFGFIPKLLKEKVEIGVYQTNAYIKNITNHITYRQALFDALEGKIKITNCGEEYSWGYLGAATEMHAGAFVRGKAYIGERCKIRKALLRNSVIIENDCIIEDDVILDNVVVLNKSIIKSGSRLRNMNIGFDSKIKPLVKFENMDEIDNTESKFLNWAMSLVKMLSIK